MEAPMNRFITINEFCERFGVGRSTAYRENKAGRLPFRKIGRSTRIAECDVQQWINNLPAQ
ncbi:helix-turn-helix transcriptional regulator [Parasphingopyxis sp. CP4]|uniref:helix-turn-helix transcriptional regulator n=1 Tax=Parasphingopyxis sp. CP4 TaxID=2724527 RepID=UPI00351A1394